jgi:hypothetical protein
LPRRFYDDDKLEIFPSPGRGHQDHPMAVAVGVEHHASGEN